MNERSTLSTQTEPEIASQAAELSRQGKIGREAAASLLYRKIGNRIIRSLMRHYVPQADAEELMINIIVKFINGKIVNSGPKSAIAFLWMTTQTELNDWLRKKNSLMRRGKDGGVMEVSLDDEQWSSLIDTVPSQTSLPQWVITCVHRASALFQHEKPRQAEILFFHAQGFSHREIAGILNGITDLEKVTQKQEEAAKARIHHACKLAREYFKECKE